MSEKLLVGNHQDAFMDAQVAAAMTKKIDRLRDESIELAIRANEARQWLEWNCSHVENSWVNWLELSNKVLEDIRLARMAIGQESSKLLAECGDVRKFFLSEDHDREITKLREFIELAERLRALKQDGTLDKLADTILKLA
jgi:hypothetical protein